MNKTVLVLSSLLLAFTGACSQIPGLTPTPGTGPTLDPESQFQTAVAQTLTSRPPDTALPSPSPVVAATETPGLETPVPLDTDTPPAETPTQVIDLSATSITATGSGVVPTATAFPAGTAAVTLAPGQVTPVWTLAVRTYGTLPPAVRYSNITLINRARTEAYISLQVTMPDGNYSIIEYPVEGRITIQAPVGSYLYVTWVGGRKMVGEFRLRDDDDMSITLFRDRVVIE